MRPQVLFDGVRVSLGFSKNGVSVSGSAHTAVHVDILAIGASVTFDGQGFQVRLSYSYFSYNTEGQCGEWDTAGSPRVTGGRSRSRAGSSLRVLPRPAPARPRPASLPPARAARLSLRVSVDSQRGERRDDERLETGTLHSPAPWAPPPGPW